jgi:hypothetical protein
MTENIPWPHKGDKLFKSGTDWWHNACLNYPGIDINTYALGYKQAADFLVRHVSQVRRYQDTLVYPIAFLYRQYLELRLKQLIRSGSMLLVMPRRSRKLHHGIDQYWKQCRNIMENIWPDEKADDFDAIEECIDEFVRIDPSSIGFRYPTSKDGSPSLRGLTHINLRNLGEVMDRIAALLDAASTGIDELIQDKHDMESWCKG